MYLQILDALTFGLENADRSCVVAPMVVIPAAVTATTSAQISQRRDWRALAAAPGEHRSESSCLSADIEFCPLVAM